MNVRIVSRSVPGRTTLYSGIGPILSDGKWLRLYELNPLDTDREYLEEPFKLPLSDIDEILLDEEGGIDW